MVGMVQPEVARASNFLWASAASLSAKRSASMRTGIGHPIADFQTAHIRGDGLYGPGAFEARDKGKRLRVVSGAVININVVEACRRLAQADLTRPGLTDIDRCPVQNLGTARLPNLHRMRHTDFRNNMNSVIL
jgi:hypothetical protein